MTAIDVYQHLNRNLSRIQNLATQLSNDFDTSRFLYQETLHQAIKQSPSLKEEEIDDWLLSTLQQTYSAQVVRPDWRL